MLVFCLSFYLTDGDLKVNNFNDKVCFEVVVCPEHLVLQKPNLDKFI